MPNSNSSNEDDPLSQMYVFLVGNSEEWPEDREMNGDGGLYNAYVKLQISPSKIEYVKDKKCKRGYCMKKLEHLLKKTSYKDTFFFYYGGHGDTDGFQTNPKKLLYVDVIEVIEKFFRGIRVILLLDCCNSGNMYLALKKKKRKHSYICISSVPPFRDANGDYGMWSLCQAWIEGLKRKETLKETISRMADYNARVDQQLLTVYSCGDNIDPEWKLSTKDCISSSLWKLDPSDSFSDWKIEINKNKVYHIHRNIIAFGPRRSEYLVRLWRKNNSEKRITYLDMNEDEVKEFPILLDYIYSNTELYEISSSLKKLATKLEVSLPVLKNPEEDFCKTLDSLEGMEIGDMIYYRYEGGYPTTQDNYLMPGWYAATIISMKDKNNVEIRVEDPPSSLKWNILVNTKVDKILGVTNIASCWSIDDEYIDFQCKLAQQLKYLDHSLAPDTQVKILWWDETLKDGIVMNHMDIEWEDISKSKINNQNVLGPQVVIEINETHSMLPLSRVAVADTLPQKLRPEQLIELMKITSSTAALKFEKETISPRQALLKSIESSGKTICNARDILNTSQLRCYYIDDREWYNAVAIDPLKAPLKSIADVTWFDVTGKYCFVNFEDENCENDEMNTIPIKYAKQRERKHNNESKSSDTGDSTDSSENESSSEDDSDTSSEEQRK